jgi:hypothetical protein
MSEGQIQFSPGGCCCCTVLYDAFDRDPGSIDKDRVNFKGMKRYEFTAGDWRVDFDADYLVCVGSTPIKFVKERGYYNVSVQVGVNTTGDWAQINFSAGNVRVEATGANQLTFSGLTGTRVVDYGGGIPAMTTLQIKFFPPDEYEDLYDRLQPRPEGVVLLAFSNEECEWKTLTIADGDSGYTDWTLSGSVDMIFDDLFVERSQKKCENQPSINCASMCFPNGPDQVTISIGGLINQTTFCYSSLYDYSTAFGFCVGENFPPGGIANCEEDCNFIKSLRSCICGYLVGSNPRCVTTCPCEALNGTYVLNKTGCCDFYLAVDSPPYGGCLAEFPKTVTKWEFTATLSYQYYDETHKITYGRFSFGSPVGGGGTELLPTTTLCSGATKSVDVTGPFALSCGECSGGGSINVGYQGSCLEGFDEFGEPIYYDCFQETEPCPGGCPETPGGDVTAIGTLTP